MSTTIRLTGSVAPVDFAVTGEQNPGVTPGVCGTRAGEHQRAGVSTWAVILLALATGHGALQADTVNVPNGSFESPTPPAGFPVNTSIDSWQETPQPVWYDPSVFGGVTWDQLTGVFPNTAAGEPNHIDNLDGSQAAYLFAIPGVALFQDYNSTDWSHPAPLHLFDAQFQVGMSYDLTVGVLGGSGMADGASLQLSFYYRDAGNNPVTIASTDVTYSLANFPTITQLRDYQVSLPAVQAGDPWAGQNIGVQIAPTSLGGTYWDVDNVRVKAVPEPGTLSLFALAFGGFWLARARARQSA